jgi:hypothetical protein
MSDVTSNTFVGYSASHTEFICSLVPYPVHTGYTGEYKLYQTTFVSFLGTLSSAPYWVHIGHAAITLKLYKASSHPMKHMTHPLPL